ncbi:MAG: response regulator [Chitinophagaceae bacterium]|nr:response regulator [Anaerolineae bacterium]
MQKLTAVVVDDDVALGDVFGFALGVIGFEVEVIKDSRLALERIIARLPDLVTLDLDMPHISGAELLRQIRADKRLAAVKVMMMTGNGRAAQEMGVEELADVILIKPVTYTQIKDFALRLVQSSQNSVQSG